MPVYDVRAMPTGANPASHSANLLCIHTRAKKQRRNVQNSTRARISDRYGNIDQKWV
jgi:hypothetical protein